MGKIFFILIVIFLIILILSIKYFFSKIESKVGNKKEENKDEKEKKKTKTSSSEGSGIWAIVVVLILTGVVNWYILHNSQHKSVIATVHPHALHGTLFWEKPEGVTGRNPKKRNDALSVVMERNDAKVMAFTADYTDNYGVAQKAHFYWEKREQYGKWYQNRPKGSGLWYLHPCSDGTYTGEVSNDMGECAKCNLYLK